MKRLLYGLIFALGITVRADVVLAPLFTDHAVLQRDKPVRIWGKAEAGETVNVAFAGQTVGATAGADGRWAVLLAAMPANREPAELVVRGKNTVRCADVLVGEVWLASGQSNMEWQVKNSHDAAIEVPASAAYPFIRHFWIEKRVADAPSEQAKGIWRVAGPQTTGGFSAVAYYFSRDLAATLNVPVGVISSSWGGTPVEAWMTSESLSSDPRFAVVAERWSETLSAYPAAKVLYDRRQADWTERKTAAEAVHRLFPEAAPRPPEGPGHRYTPGGLYNAMIHSFAPCALRGVIWYQGENNVAHPDEYAGLFAALITGWRKQFAQDALPFYWVQLPNYRGSREDGLEFARLREAQDRILVLPATGQAVAIDLGNAGDIHPRNKIEVGRRLARLALNRTYGVKLADSGPVFAKAERQGAGFRVTFTAAEGGLITPCDALPGFELAGADRVFHPAEARIEGDAVVVSSAAAGEPVAVRYAWKNAPAAGLYNGEGLPAAPFRTDTW